MIEKKKQNEENLDKRFTIAPGALGDSMRASGASDGTPRSPRDTGIMGGMAGAQMGSFLNDSKHNVKDPLSFGMAVCGFLLLLLLFVVCCLLLLENVILFLFNPFSPSPFRSPPMTPTWSFPPTTNF